MRAALNGDDGHLDNLQRAAKRLAMSPRTLQRRLSEAGTTFRRELALARIRRAQHLLVSSELSMSRVAFEVGFSTSQNFSRHFARMAGRAPSEFRRATRRGAGGA